MAKAARARRRLSLTSLIDVIFLLLLFFMLTSTFSQYAEVELAAGGAGQAPASDNAPAMFLQLGADTVTLNGQSVVLDALVQTMQAFLGDEGTAQQLLVSLRDDVSAQRLTDLLVVLRAVPDLRVTVLGSR